MPCFRAQWRLQCAHNEPALLDRRAGVGENYDFADDTETAGSGFALTLALAGL